MHDSHTFVGFGFGAIQSGLFLAEAFATGRFNRLVVAEVNPERVDAIRGNGGTFSINVALADKRVTHEIRGVDIFNPTVPKDAKQLAEALAEASEISTALPSIEFFDRGEPSVATLLSQALHRKIQDSALPSAIVYTAENHNHAAEHLDARVFADAPVAARKRMQMLNTVIGKMSSVVTDPAQIEDLELAPIVPGATEAFLVESFNRIFISEVTMPGFNRMIDVFEEKPDLLPFEEAKLYGHNAIHALLGYLGQAKGLRTMAELAEHSDLLDIARRAFVKESGAALVSKYHGLDPLFTEPGFSDYAEDLLERMLNPNLQDPIERIVRDPLRKLGWNDRIIGAMRLALSQGIQPRCLAQGGQVALGNLKGSTPLETLRKQWQLEGATPVDIDAVEKLFI